MFFSESTFTGIIIALRKCAYDDHCYHFSGEQSGPWASCLSASMFFKKINQYLIRLLGKWLGKP